MKWNALWQMFTGHPCKDLEYALGEQSRRDLGDMRFDADVVQRRSAECIFRNGQYRTHLENALDRLSDISVGLAGVTVSGKRHQLAAVFGPSEIATQECRISQGKQK